MELVISVVPLTVTEDDESTVTEVIDIEVTEIGFEVELIEEEFAVIEVEFILANDGATVNAVELLVFFWVCVELSPMADVSKIKAHCE